MLSDDSAQMSLILWSLLEMEIISFFWQFQVVISPNTYQNIYI
jgi:hypothetical protein